MSNIYGPYLRSNICMKFNICHNILFQPFSFSLFTLSKLYSLNLIAHKFVKNFMFHAFKIHFTQVVPGSRHKNRVKEVHKLYINFPEEAQICTLNKPCEILCVLIETYSIENKKLNLCKHSYKESNNAICRTHQ